MDKKKLQPLTLKWLEHQFPNFFERSPNLSLVNTPETTTQALNNVWKNHDCRPIADFWQYVAKCVFNVSILLFSQ